MNKKSHTSHTSVNDNSLTNKFLTNLQTDNSNGNVILEIFLLRGTLIYSRKYFTYWQTFNNYTPPKIA